MSDVTPSSMTLVSTEEVYPMATVEEIQNYVKTRRRIPVSNTTAFPDAWFYDEIAESFRTIWNAVSAYFQESSITFRVAGGGREDLPPGTVEVLQVLIPPYEPLDNVTLAEIADYRARGLKGRPRAFAVVQGVDARNVPQILTDYAPDSDYTGTVWAKRTFTQVLTDPSDALDYPADWLDCVKFFMVAASYELDEDPRADRWYAKAQAKLQEIVNVNQDRYNQQFSGSRPKGREIIVDGYAFPSN